MNNKRKIVLTSILSIVVCLMLVAGATFAMFTDESEVSIAVTGGKIDLEAKINASSLKAYSQSYNYEQNKYEEYGTQATDPEKDDEYQALFSVAENVHTGGIAKATKTQVTLDHMAPLDRVTFDIEIKNNSDIDAAYRIYVLHEGKLAEALEISYLHTQAGANGYQILSNSTDWTTISHTTGGSVVETVGVEIVFPDGGKPTAEAGDNQYQATSCTLTFVVEAYQAYAKLDPQAQAPRTWLVSNQTGLTAVAGLCNSGDTIKLQGESWETAEFATEKALSLKMEGAPVGTLKVDAPNAEIEIANAVTNLNIVAIKNGTAKIAGAVTNLALEKGKVEILSTGSVANFSSSPVANTTVTLKIAEGKTVNVVNAGGEGKTVINGMINQINLGAQASVQINGVEFGKGVQLTEIAEGFYKTDDSTYFISNKAGLNYFANEVNSGKSYAGKTVNLIANIDLEDVKWMSMNGFAGTFDGQNCKISNMNIVDNTSNYAAFFATFGGTIKNVTFEKAYVEGNRAAIVAEWTFGGPVVFDHVAVVDSVVNGEQKNGGLLGFASGRDNGGCTDVTITNCTVDGLTFQNDDTKERAWQSGAIIGYVHSEQNLTVTGNTVNNISITYDPATPCPAQPLYGSHPLIGALNASNSAGYKIVISGNTIGVNSGFAIGDSHTEFCGSHTDFTAAGSAIVMYNGACVTPHVAVSEAYQIDADEHWHVCAICGQKFDKAQHSFNEGGVCACGLKRGNIVSSSSELSNVIRKAKEGDIVVLNNVEVTYQTTLTESVTLSGTGTIKTGNDVALQVSGGAGKVVTVDGLTIESNKSKAVNLSDKSTLVIEDATIERTEASNTGYNQLIFANDDAEITINGGEFTHTAGDFAIIIDFDDKAGKAEISDGDFTVGNVTKSQARVIKLDSDVVGDIKLSGGNYILNGSNGAIVSGGKQGTNIVIDGGTYKVGGSSYLVNSSTATVIVNDCTFVSDMSISTGSPTRSGIFYVSDTAKVIVKGGNYTLDTTAEHVGISCFSSQKGNIILEGGTFNVRPSLSATIAEGFKEVQNADGTYSVVAK